MTETPETNARERSGHCLCGQIRFTARVGGSIEACHCRMCQRWTGSALLGAAAAGDAVRIEGDSLRRFQSSAWAERAFCENCGTGLFYRVTAPGPHHDRHYIPVALFDDAEGLELVGEIFYDQRLGVFEFAGETNKKTQAEVMAQFAQSSEP